MYFKAYGYTSMFSAISVKGNNFCDFLFASLAVVALSKGIHFQRKVFSSFYLKMYEYAAMNFHHFLQREATFVTSCLLS